MVISTRCEVKPAERASRCPRDTIDAAAWGRRLAHPGRFLHAVLLRVQGGQNIGPVGSLHECGDLRHLLPRDDPRRRSRGVLCAPGQTRHGRSGTHDRAGALAGPSPAHRADRGSDRGAVACSPTSGQRRSSARARFRSRRRCSFSMRRAMYSPCVSPSRAARTLALSRTM